jgi:SAM-dependent methyltransferase
MTNHRLSQFRYLDSRLDVTGNSANVLEIGAGNGQYSLLLGNVFGRCDATEFNQSGSYENVSFISTHPDEDDFLEKLAHKMPYDLIACFSYLEHLPDPKTTLKLIYELLSEDGLAIIEVPNSSFIQRKSLLNEVIPDHLHYFSTQSLTTAIYSAGFELESIQPTWHDYILTAILRKPHNNSLSTIETNYDRLKKSIQSTLSSYADNATIVVWGAGHQALYTIATTALKDRLNMIVDSSPAKQGAILPHLGIPVVSPSDIERTHIDLLFVICAGYNDEVIHQLSRLSFVNNPRCYSVASNQLFAL